MSTPLLRPSLTLTVVVLLLAGLRTVTLLWPADLAATGPELEAARSRRAQLAGFTDERRAALQDRERRLRADLWTNATFAHWKKRHLSAGWIVQDLGSVELKTCRAHRYAFTRPAATSAQWTEIAGLLAALEEHPGIQVQTVSLAAKPGYLGSRTFSQCIFVTRFFFAEETAAGAAPP